LITSANGYTPAAAGFTFHAGGTIPQTDTYTFQAYLNNTNALATGSLGVISNLGTQLGSTLTFSNPFPTGACNLGTCNFGGNTVGNISPFSQSPYAVSIKSVFSGATGSGNSLGSYNAQLNTTPVPEPAVVTLLGGVMLLTVGAIRRKSRRA
jgi:hypothetical protein